MDFWSDRIWLPGDVTWADLERFELDGNDMARASDLVIIPIIACGLILARMAFEATLGKWVAAQFNIRNAKKIVPTPNVTLERAYDKSRKLKRETHVQLLKELGPDWSERKVERWFRHKRNLAKMPAVRKFTETLWRFVFYVVIYVYGTVTLFEQPWFSNHDHCWTDYPLQAMPFSSKVYYFAELAFYLSLAMTLLWDNKRKDFTEQIVHHIATLLLLSLSYVCNFTRIGTLVMWAHDISDIFLESAKLCVYARKTTAADILFGLFACAFFLSRLVYYPLWILDTSWNRSMRSFSPYFGYYVFNGLLFILQILHIIWFSLIVKMALGMWHGKEVEDTRSSDEEQDSDLTADNTTKNK